MNTVEQKVRGNRKILIAAMLIAFSVFLGLGLLAYFQLHEQRVQYSTELSHNLSVQLSDSINLWINEQTVQTKTLAGVPAIRAFCQNPGSEQRRAVAQDVLKEAHANQPYLIDICIAIFKSDDFPIVIEVEGAQRYISQGNIIVDSLGGRGVGVDVSARNYVKAILGGALSYVSAAMPYFYMNADGAFTISAPVKDEQGEIIAVLFYVVKLNSFINLFLSPSLIEHVGSLDIIDERGFVVSSLNSARIMNQDLQGSIGQLVKNLNPDQAAYFSAMLNGKDSNFTAYPINLTAPHQTRWYALVVQSKQVLFDELKHSLLWIVSLCVLSACLFTVMVWKMHISGLRKQRLDVAQQKENYIDSAPYAIIVFNSESGIIEDVNPAACEIFGYAAGDFANMHINRLLPLDDETAPDLSESTARPIERAGLRKDGSRMVGLCAARQLNSGQILLFVRDETELVHGRQALLKLSRDLVNALEDSEQQRHAAEKANRAKNEFIANMSHEIRTPMNTILGIDYLLQQTSLSDEQNEYLNNLDYAAKSLLVILNDILDFSKIEAGKITLEKIPFSPKELVGKVGKLYAIASQGKQLAMTVTLAEDLPPLILGDPTRLEQVLNNLLNNAIKFTEKGGITLGCALKSIDANQAGLVFTVRDSGIGISRENQQKIFSAFTQADSSTTRRFGGTGLGLVICRRLVELMGGSISLESELNQGTTFIVECPFELASRQQAEDYFAGHKPDVNYASQLAGFKVLLVEDNQVNQRIGIALLKRVNIDVAVADNGQLAVDIVARQSPPFDAILMDVQMPVMDGYTATQHIKRLAAYQDVPIIALTAHAFSEERERTLASGMVDHIAKPIDVDNLYATLAKWLVKDN